MADLGADANFISVSFLVKIENSVPFILSKRLSPSQTHCNVAGEPCLTCHHTEKIYEYLYIRHGTSVILRKIFWMVTLQELETTTVEAS